MKIVYYFFLFLIFTIINCKKNEIAKKSTKKIENIYIQKDKILDVEFNANIILKWNSSTNDFIKDNNYNSIKKKNNFSVLIDNISNVEDLKIKICSKKENLKKGDIAFLYLKNIGKLEIYRCMHVQFDVLNQNCPFPNELLNYLENNRLKVKKQMLQCI